MADSVDYKITGLDSVIGKMKALSNDVKYKGGRAALRAAARVVVKAAKENAQGVDDPETVESITKNIVERWDGNLFKRTGDLGFRVGVLGGAAETKSQKKSYPGGDTWYWRFKEFGTSRIPATPFMRPALADNVDQAITAFVFAYEKSIDRVIKRAKKASIT